MVMPPEGVSSSSGEVKAHKLHHLLVAQVGRGTCLKLDLSKRNTMFSNTQEGGMLLGRTRSWPDHATGGFYRDNAQEAL